MIPAVSVPGSAAGFNAQSIYDEAARDYEDASRDYWQYIPTRTLERLDLRAGERVLDVPCGTGPSVLLAAERVGPEGRVVGIDYAEQMLAITAEKVRAAGHTNVDLAVADMTKLDPADFEPFDAVICSLGLFFVDDVAGLLRTLAALLRPGGRLGVAVFGEHVFDPIREFFIETAGRLSPGVEILEPWKRTEDIAVLRAAFEAAGLTDVTIDTEDDRLPMPSPDDWWRVVMGSGFRRTVVALDAPTAAELRQRCDAYFVDNGIEEILIRARYAVARAAS